MNSSRSLLLLAVVGLLISLLPSGMALGVSAAEAPEFAYPQFEAVWARADLPVAQGSAARSWLWGPAPGETRSEPFAGAPGGNRTVQYFDKARMELNPQAEPGSQWATTTGLLVSEMVGGKLQTGPSSYEDRAPADIPVAGDANVAPELVAGVPLYSSFRKLASVPGGADTRAAPAIGSAVVATVDRAGNVGALAGSAVRYSAYAEQTGHNIPDVFERFMAARGVVYEGGVMVEGPLLDWVYVLGYPISEAYWATVPIGGKPERVLIQLYQRRVLTYVPGYTPAWQVQMGNVGRHYFSWRYETPRPEAVAPAGPTATPEATGPAAGDSWLHMAGGQFYHRGRQVRLKGTNYWMSKRPFVGTWAEWDGYTVQEELRKAKELGVNSIRIGIPYDNWVAVDVVWGEGCEQEDARCEHMNGWIAHQMTELLQIAAGYEMKVLFVLFDWSDEFPPKESREYRKQLRYLHGVVAPFVNDDRVIGWDLHNEPENYGPWLENNGPAKVISWLANIGAEVKAIDPRHPVTVGMGNYENLWLEAGGTTILDISDFVSFHSYDAGGLAGQIAAVKARTNKPILLEEMGWPSGPAELNSAVATYDEATQQFLYRVMLAEAKNTNLSGVMQWALWDNPIGTPDHYIKPTVESWFGLVRRDGSFKPAATDFRESYVVAPLPSDTKTNVPFTRSGRRP